MKTSIAKQFGACLLLIVAFLAPALPGRCASPEADVKKVVETFYADYIHLIKKPSKDEGDARLIGWTKANPHASPGFKKILEKTTVAARKKDPELGLGSDPILAGQDYPDKGYRAKTISISKNKAKVVMEGVGDPGFRIPLELINVDGQWLIDGIADLRASTK